jgi:uncharacterized protein (UPF0332 family)
MKFDWLSYLEVAQILLEEVKNYPSQENNLSLNEAKIRSAISRAYYSVFCLTRNYLRDSQQYSQLENRTANVHQNIINHLINSQKPDLKNLGNDLRRLRKLRNDADYEDEIPFHSLNANAKSALRLANNIIKLLDKLNKN